MTSPSSANGDPKDIGHILAFNRNYYAELYFVEFKSIYRPLQDYFPCSWGESPGSELEVYVIQTCKVNASIAILIRIERMNQSITLTESSRNRVQ